MAEIWRIKERGIAIPSSAFYEQLVGGIGREDFGDAVLDAINSRCGGATRLYLFEARSREESNLHYHFCEPDIAAQFPVYSRSYRQIDPVCDAYRFAQRPGDIVAQRIGSADIAVPGFRRRFFDETGIVERISIIQRGPAQWRGMNVARDLRLGQFSDMEVEALLGIAWLALPLLSLNQDRAQVFSPPTLAELEDRFARRFPRLSRRECQVCARGAHGMSIEATALDLDIGKASVLTYRRRAYQRLAVSSPFELSALVAH
jgi:DNA-binding CsgD family transcriptional regulator